MVTTFGDADRGPVGATAFSDRRLRRLRRKESEMNAITTTQYELLFAAWAVAEQGSGLVLEPQAYPDADRLAEAGWLERRFEGRGAELSWHWTHQAGAALRVSALQRDRPADWN